MSKFALLFLLAFVYCVYAMFVFGPVYGFYIYEINYFLNPNSRWWFSSLPKLPYSFTIVVIMMVTFMLTRTKHTLNHASRSPEFKWVVALFLSFAAASFFAVNSELHNRFFIEYCKLIVTMYIAFRLLDTERKLKIAMVCFIIGAAYIGMEAFNVGRNSGARVEGIGMVDSPDSNMTAAALVPTIPLIIYFGWQLKWKYKVVLGVLAILIINGLILINSRGAFLGMVAGGGYFLMYMLFSKYKMRQQKLMLVLIAVVGVAGLFRFTDAVFWERMQTIETSSSKESEGSGGRRINFWLATFDMMDDYPMGVGIFGYQTLSPFYLKDESYFDDVKAVDGVKMRAVHSIWFQGLSEVGWHGMFFFVLLLWSIKRNLSKSKKFLIEHRQLRLYYLAVAIEGAFISFLISGSFIDVFRVQVLYWLVLYGICFNLIVFNKKQELLKNTAAEKANVGGALA